MILFKNCILLKMEGVPWTHFFTNCNSHFTRRIFGDNHTLTKVRLDKLWLWNKHRIQSNYDQPGWRNLELRLSKEPSQIVRTNILLTSDNHERKAHSRRYPQKISIKAETAKFLYGRPTSNSYATRPAVPRRH